LNRRRAERRAASAPLPATRIRVLVVEDNRLMRDGLARLLSAYPDVDIVASAESANAAAQQLKDAKPQVVLLDAALANGDSYAFLSSLKQTAPDAKAIVMDFVPAQQDVTQFIDGGANGFIMKDATAEDIAKAIRTVASGTDLPPPPAAPRAAVESGSAATSRSITSRNCEPTACRSGSGPALSTLSIALSSPTIARCRSDFRNFARASLMTMRVSQVESDDVPPKLSMAANALR